MIERGPRPSRIARADRAADRSWFRAGLRIQPARWIPLNHSLGLNQLLGFNEPRCDGPTERTTIRRRLERADLCVLRALLEIRTEPISELSVNDADEAAARHTRPLNGNGRLGQFGGFGARAQVFG